MTIRLADNDFTFKGKRTTKKGNDYNHTNTLKYTCMAGGAAVGGVKAYTTIKAVKEEGEMLERMVDAVLDVIKKYDASFAGESSVNIQKAKNFVAKVAKVGAWGLLPLGFALIGLAIGAICDFTLNKSRARQADKLADLPKQENNQSKDAVIEEKLETKNV